MPTVFLHTHSDLVMIAMACRTQAAKLRAYADATASIAAKHSLLNAAKANDEQAARFSAAAEQQLLMWKINRKR